MTKTDQIIALISIRHITEPHADFYKILSKLITNDLFALMGKDYDIKRVDTERPHIKELLNTLAHLLSYEQIKSRHAKEILETAWNTNYGEWDLVKYITDNPIDEIPLDSIIDSVIVEQAKAVADYKNGKTQVMGRLIGCVMKKTNGKADPETAKKLFEERIK